LAVLIPIIALVIGEISWVVRSVLVLAAVVVVVELGFFFGLLIIALFSLFIMHKSLFRRHFRTSWVASASIFLLLTSSRWVFSIHAI
jgi:hypothetical protein